MKQEFEMTLEEKAQDLIEKFMPHAYQLKIRYAKELAALCVVEIMQNCVINKLPYWQTVLNIKIMNTEKWLEDEGYPMVMSISRSSLADIILRFIHVHGLNPKEPETVHGNEAEKVVNGETFYCRFCDDKFTDEYDLEAHVKFHH